MVLLYNKNNFFVKELFQNDQKFLNKCISMDINKNDLTELALIQIKRFETPFGYCRVSVLVKNQKATIPKKFRKNDPSTIYMQDFVNIFKAV